MNIAHTDDTQLNVFAEFVPKLCEENRAAEMLFLGNIQPDLQRQVREEADGAKFVALDSMNLWIETAKGPLLDVIGMIDCVLLNDAELRMLTVGQPRRGGARDHGTQADHRRGQARRVRRRPVHRRRHLRDARPADRRVRDPTGAGDSFAGGFLGFLDGLGAHSPSNGLRQAMVRGSAMASFSVEDFGTERVRRLERRDEIDARVAAFKDLTHF